MKKNATIICFLLCIFLTAKGEDNKIVTTKPEPLPEQEFTFPSYTEYTLKNGLKVFIIEDNEQPTVTIQLLVAGGTSVDGEKPGIADMTAELLTKGTKKYNALELAQKLDGVGASINASANVDYITVSGGSLTKHLNLLIDAFSEVVLRPSFPGKEFDKLVPKMLAGIQEEKASPGTLAANLAKKVIYGDTHPYALQPSEASIKEIKNDDIENYYKNYFKPNNASIAIVGDVKPKEILDKLEKALGTWKKGDVPKIKIPPAKPLPIGVYFVNRPASVQSSIL
ncbi:MAG: pitrilysin family protein, partial [FCB group bacterium]